jgi:hypothetical protein
MRTHRALAIAACSAAAVLWSQLALMRLATVHHHTFDLAEYARLSWGLAHGQAWDAIMGGNVLGGHMPWVLAPLGAIGALWSALWGDGLGTTKTLLVAQACTIAFSGYPIFRIAARWLGSSAAVMIVVAYLAYPTLGHVATYEMHPGSLALLPLAFALDAIDARSPKQLVIACLCALACRASLGMELMALGALAWLAARGDAREAAAVVGNPRRAAAFAHVPALRNAGVAVAAIGFSYLALSMLVLRPTFGGQPGAAGSLDLHFGPWGGSPFGIALALFTRPGDVLGHLGSEARLMYVPMLLAPWAFVPLLAPRTLLLALPAIAINLASAFPTTTRIDSHYLTSAVPALAVAAVYGLHRIGTDGLRLLGKDSLGWRSLRPLAFAALAVGLLANATAGGMPWSLDFVAGDFSADARTRAAHAVLGQIPAGISVQAPDPLLPYLAERTLVHRAPPPDRNTQRVVLDLSHRALYARREDLLRTQQEPVARAWLARPDMAVLAFADPYVLLGRGHNPRGGYVRRYFVARERVRPADGDVRLARCVALRSVVIAATPADQIAREPFMLVLTLRPDSACPSDLALRFGMPPKRVDLPCDGLLSPAHWRSGDLIRSHHPVNDRELAEIERYGLWLGALRSSGARPEPNDPIVVNVSVLARP